MKLLIDAELVNVVTSLLLFNQLVIDRCSVRRVAVAIVQPLRVHHTNTILL